MESVTVDALGEGVRVQWHVICRGAYSTDHAPGTNVKQRYPSGQNHLLVDLNTTCDAYEAIIFAPDLTVCDATPSFETLK